MLFILILLLSLLLLYNYYFQHYAYNHYIYIYILHVYLYIILFSVVYGVTLKVWDGPPIFSRTSIRGQSLGWASNLN